MSLGHGAGIVRSGLLLHLDAANRKSYIREYATGPELVTDANLLTQGDGLLRTCVRTSVVNTPVSIASVQAGKKYVLNINIPANRGTIQASMRSAGSSGNVSPSHILNAGQTGNFIYSFTVLVSGTLTVNGDSTGTDLDIDYASLKELNSDSLVGSAWNDMSGNNYVGTLRNNPIFSTANNGVFELDGTNDWINLGGSVFNFSAPWTMCGWLLKNANGTIASLMGNSSTSATGSGAFLGLAGAGGQANKPWLIVYNSSGSQTQLYGSTITVPNTWYNLVATHDGTTCKIYCNGNYENQVPVSGFAISNDQFTIGAQRNTYWPLNGKIGPVKIYSRALSNIEIAQNFNALRGRFGI